MCGINGIFAYGGRSLIDESELVATRDAMTRRGPDGFGAWIADDRRLGFGHRRLSFLDLSEAGAQPMVSADGRYIVTFNGEIYNFREVRAELEARGATFRSQSDTEVIIEAWRMMGPAMLNRLRGMFAFALWDTVERRLVLARDPYGIKPLYVADDGSTMRFASCVKALLAGGNVPRTPDPAGIVGFEIFGSVPEPFTLWRSIRAIPAGTWLSVDGQGVGKPQSYFTLAAAFSAAEAAPTMRSAGEAQDHLRQTMLDSVRHHLIADVPIGAFLSAGVDSSAVVGLMRDAGQNDIRTVTLAFDAFSGTANDESQLAAQTAALYGTQHVTRVIGKQEFIDDLPRILDAMDQPSIDGLNTWFVSKATRELGLKAAVSGVGGDEILGGYSTFRDVPRLISAMRFVPHLPLGPIVGHLAGLMRRLGLPQKAAGIPIYGHDYPGAWLLRRSVFLPAELQAVSGEPELTRQGLAELNPVEHVRNALQPMPQSAYGRVATLESSFYLRNQLLRDADWAGMAHSVEIRTPLVDTTVLQQLAPLFARGDAPQGKALLAGAPLRPIPDAVLNRPKTGFGVPMALWYAELAASLGEAAVPVNRFWSRRWMEKVKDYSRELAA